VNWLHALFGWIRTDAVSVDRGVGAGRDIRDSTIQIGLDEKDIAQWLDEAQRPVTEQLASLTAQIAREKGVEVAPLRAILVKLGEAGIPDHEIPSRLDAAADQLIELRPQLARLTHDRPEFASIRNQALAHIDQGELDAARAALARGREAARALRDNVSRNEAEFLADEARIDHLLLDYRAAADKFAEAAALVTSFNRDVGWEYLVKQAHELYNHGAEFGENQSLLQAIGVYRSALTLVPRELVPLQWARTQTNLGRALLRLGAREDGTARLEEAVAACREALKELTHELMPLQWARTHTNLGNALLRLGEREDGTARLEEAVAAFREALKEYMRELVPLQWAMTQTNLGTVLSALGSWESGTARLEEAVTVYHEALKVETRERVPLEWALTQNNLGNALFRLGERESGTARLKDAVAAYCEALKEHTRERTPRGWEMTQYNLKRATELIEARS
jgi:tetratricopeptide (TPR) repeat protein